MISSSVGSSIVFASQSHQIDEQPRAFWLKCLRSRYYEICHMVKIFRLEYQDEGSFSLLEARLCL